MSGVFGQTNAVKARKKVPRNSPVIPSTIVMECSCWEENFYLNLPVSAVRSGQKKHFYSPDISQHRTFHVDSRRRPLARYVLLLIVVDWTSCRSWSLDDVGGRRSRVRRLPNNNVVNTT